MLSILSFSFLATLLGMPIRLLLPGYAAAVFGDEGSTLGLLQMGTEIPPPRLNRPSKTHGTVAYPLGLLASIHRRGEVSGCGASTRKAS